MTHSAMVSAVPALEGELLLRRDWREAGGRFGVGDLVTRDGTDVQRCIDLQGDGADVGVFVCVVAPKPWADGEPAWCAVGDTETNLTRRYDPFSKGLALPPGGLE